MKEPVSCWESSVKGKGNSKKPYAAEERRTRKTGNEDNTLGHEGV